MTGAKRGSNGASYAVPALAQPPYCDASFVAKRLERPSAVESITNAPVHLTVPLNSRAAVGTDFRRRSQLVPGARWGRIQDPHYRVKISRTPEMKLLEPPLTRPSRPVAMYRAPSSIHCTADSDVAAKTPSDF